MQAIKFSFELGAMSFHSKRGIVFEHKVSKMGIEIDKSNIEALENLPIPQDINNLKMFLGHAGFYRRFIKDFAKVAMPLTNLFEKDTPFYLDRKSTRLNSSHSGESRMPSSA